jgi:hypothetical protein
MEMSSSASVDWSAFPLTLRPEHLATIYGYSIRTIRNLAAARSPKIPTPSTARPFGWNRADVQRHYDRRVA